MMPLTDGNQWTYVCETPHPGFRTPQTVRVTGAFLDRGISLSRIENYMFPMNGAEMFFFTDCCGKTCEVNPRLVNAHQKLGPVEPISGAWYCCQEGFLENLGAEFEIPAMAADCVHGVRGCVTAAAMPITVPAGSYPWSVTLNYYDHPCADSQVLSETLVPGLGLVRRTVSTFTGTQVWSLCSAVVNGRLYGSPDGCDLAGEGTAAVEASTWGAIKSNFSD